MADDPLKGLPRLGSDALGPCIGCNRVMLATGFPLFLRFRVQRCGIDANEVRRHVGLGMAMGGGAAGLTLASAMGPKCEPVIIMDEYADVNVCHECATKLTAEDVHHLVLMRDTESRGGPDDRRGGYASSSPSLSEEKEANDGRA